MQTTVDDLNRNEAAGTEMLPPSPAVQEFAATFFAGLSPEERELILRHVKHRTFPEGSIIVAPNDDHHELCIIQSGMATISAVGRDGKIRVVARLGPGATLGELSFFTGHRPSVTVRAATDVELFALREDEFRHLAAQIPRIYANVGAIMAEKLAQTDAGRSRTGLKLAAHVIDHGDDPLIAYSLAASVAWHTRRPTLLLVVSDGAKPREELSALARLDQGSPIPDPCAHVAFCPVSRSSPEALDTAISEYALRYHHIVIQLPPDWPLPETDATKVYLDSERASAAPKPGLYTIRCRAAHGSLRPDHRGVLSVPPLTNTEREELRTGLLSTSGAAGKALGWAARDLAHLKVGVALGAGGSKGFGHLGVLEVLLGQGLPIDAVSGTSIGSCVAALYSLGYSLDDMTKIVADVGAAAWSPTFPRSSILSLRRLKRHFQGLTKGRRLEDLPIPTAIVAADMLTHRQVVFRRGLIWQALLASIAIPGAFPPQPVGGHLLVDGGVVNPVPSNVAADLGADIVIGVKLAVHTFGPPIETPAIEAIGTAPWIFHTMMRSMEIMQTRVTAASAETATIQIDLDFSHELDPGLRHFAEGKRFIELGRKAAGEALPRVAAALPWMAPQRGNQA